MRFGLGLDGQYCDQYNSEIVSFIASRSGSHLSIVSPDLTVVEQLVPSSGLVIHHLSGVGASDAAGPNVERVAQLDVYSAEMRAVWCCEDLGTWSLGSMPLPYFVPPPLTEEVCSFVALGVERIQEASSVPFLVENPYYSVVSGNLSLADFFTKLVNRSGCSLVLDLPHLVSYCMATSSAPERELSRFPLAAVTEIHLAGGKVSPKYQNRYVDTHSDPILEVVYDLLDQALEGAKNLRAVTYEVGKDLVAETFLAEAKKIESSLARANFAPFSDAV
ncbi:DUF692 family multinuclear iron-containing protein [Roseateles sp. MS654]|uniref:multinuclear nonheme iron-dependent oxidase n=1 Tax=Roseateles sp. MS654 TaxID=3412685 RepID=UPI003C2DB7C6